MSLEAAIDRNTSALETMIALMKASASSAQSTHVPVAIKTVADAAPVEAKKPVAAVTQPVAETLLAKTEAAAVSPTEPIKYDAVSKAITDGVKVNRAKVVAALEQFGAKKGTELKPEQYAEFLGALAVVE